MAREAAFLRDLGWAVGGGRTRAGRPPTEKAGTEAWEWGGLGARNQEAFRASRKKTLLPGRSGSLYRKFIIKESHLHAE